MKRLIKLAIRLRLVSRTWKAVGTAVVVEGGILTTTVVRRTGWRILWWRYYP